MKVFIFIDDIRTFNPYLEFMRHQDDCQVFYCQDYWETIKILDAVKNNKETYIDLDHDLGPGPNGYDICKYIVENQIPLAGFHIHSMNPVGTQNMRTTLHYYGVGEY